MTSVDFAGRVIIIGSGCIGQGILPVLVVTSRSTAEGGSWSADEHLSISFEDPA